MNNLRLPTSGDANWGSTLNAYLESLDSKIKSLETRYSQLQSDSAIKNIGYASSGIVGEAKISYDSIKEVVSFVGNVFVSGDINTYFTVDVKSVDYTFSSLLADTSAFVYLKYISDTDFEIIFVDEEFQANYTTILIGLIYRANNNLCTFVPYYHSSLKTLMEVQYEMANRWADLENSYLSLEIDGSLPTLVNCDKYTLYCGGLGIDSISKFYTQNLGVQRLSITPTGVIIKLVDTVDLTENIINTTRNDFIVSGQGSYYRIMLDVYGNVILQQSYQTNPLEGDGTWREQQVLNARFGNTFPAGMNANLMVEVARFGYNAIEIADGIYCQDPTATSGFSTFENMTFVKSIINGVAAQQSPRVWVTRDSQIELDKTTFRNSATSDMGFKINYQGADEISEITIDRANAQSNELLFTKSEKAVQVGTLDILGAGGITFTSDRRRKENFSAISESYLEVVEKVPVMNYNYKNSLIPQVGIIAQDLEATNISNVDCFIKIEDSLELKNKRSLYETKLVYILWKALQEESELRKKLEQRVADLEAK